MTEPRTKRMPGVRWWHKWIGIFIGVLLLIWVASGLIMILPASTVSRRTDAGLPVDWSRVTVSPAQAAALAMATAPGATVQRVEVKRIREAVGYVVRLDHGRQMLFDASSGAPMRITSEIAGAIAAEPVPGAKVARVERITAERPGYYGARPAWHVFLDDAKHTEAYVAEGTGDVVRNQRWDRTKDRLGHNLHVFMPLRALPGKEATRLWVLMITGLIALISILTGYWLALPKRWRGPA